MSQRMPIRICANLLSILLTVVFLSSPAQSAVLCKDLFAGEGHTFDLSKIVEEQRMLSQGPESQDRLTTGAHMQDFQYMISRLNQILSSGHRTVYDGERQHQEYAVYHPPLTEGTRKLITQLKNDLASMSNGRFIDRAHFIEESILFTALYSSFRTVFEANPGDLFEAKFKPHERQFILSSIELEKRIESSDGNLEELFLFLRSTAPFSQFLGRNISGMPLSIDLDERGIVRIWGRGNSPFGITDAITFADGWKNGFNPLQFIWHDFLHAFTGARQRQMSGETLSAQYVDHINAHLDSIVDQTEHDAETAVVFFMDHELEVPYVSFKAWAGGEPVHDLSGQGFANWTDEDLARRLASRMRPGNMAIRLGDSDETKQSLLTAIHKLKNLYLSWAFLPSSH